MLRDQIRVSVVDYGRSNLYMRYTDPITGKHVARSTGTKNKREAERVAAVWEAELKEGRYKSPTRVTWEEFRTRFEDEKLSGLSDNYAYVMSATFNHFETLGIRRLTKIDADAVSRFQANLRMKGINESTIRCYLKHLKAALSWAVEIGLMESVPKITLPKRARTTSQMKGRPITLEEFERMLADVEKIRPEDANAWRHYLQGLWLSGLRLAESLIFSWDQDSPISVDLSGKHPRFRILAEGQKRNRDELLPMTPDFAEWLLRTYESEREGAVFKLVGRSGALKADAAGRIVSKIGKRAAVSVGNGRHATAHDLRRSFGTRWSAKVKPAVLQKLMRHADIKTTMAFYVSHEADDIAAELWANHSPVTLEVTPHDFDAQKESRQKAETSCQHTSSVSRGDKTAIELFRRGSVVDPKRLSMMCQALTSNGS